MLMIPREELNQVAAAGVILDMAPAVPLALSIGSAVGTSGAITAGGGLGALGTMGAATVGIAFSGATSSFIAGFALGTAIGKQNCVRDTLSGLMDELFGQ